MSAPFRRRPWRARSRWPCNCGRRPWPPGVKEERLIFDPVLPNLSWPDAWAQVGAIVKLVRLLTDGALFQTSARTLVGLSNLRSGLRQTYPNTIDEACLYLLAGAGLTYVLADVLQPGLMESVRFINQVV